MSTTAPSTSAGARILAIDIGTSSVKAGVISGSGQIVGAGAAGTQLLTSSAGWSEIDVEATWTAVIESCRQAIGRSRRSSLDAIAVTGARGTFALVDHDSSPLTPFITWQDRRATDIASRLISDSSGVPDFYSICGTFADATTVLPRWLWLRESAGIATAASAVQTPQSLVLQRLGAREPICDWSAAAHFAMFDVRKLEWDQSILAYVGITPHNLPLAVMPGTVVGQLASSAANILGLRNGMPLVPAASDGICAELGSGVVESNQMYGYLGTASAIASPLAAFQLDPERRVVVSPGSIPTRWRALALGLAGASVLDWIRELFGGPTFAEVELMAKASPAGARGVRFMPTLAGANYPVKAEAARGKILGVSLRSTRADIIRSALEGVAVEMYWMMRAVESVGVASETLLLTGGGTKIQVWAQILANVLGVTVRRVREPHPGLRGGGLYGLAAVDSSQSVVDLARRLSVASVRYDPDPSCRDLYAEMTATYRDLAERLSGALIC